MKVRVVSEQDDPDFLLIQVEGDAPQPARKSNELLEADAAKPGDCCDSRRDCRDRPHLARCELKREAVSRPLHGGERPVNTCLQTVRSHVRLQLPAPVGLSSLVREELRRSWKVKSDSPRRSRQFSDRPRLARY